MTAFLNILNLDHVYDLARSTGKRLESCKITLYFNFGKGTDRIPRIFSWKINLENRVCYSSFISELDTFEPDQVKTILALFVEALDYIGIKAVVIDISGFPAIAQGTEELGFQKILNTSEYILQLSTDDRPLSYHLDTSTLTHYVVEVCGREFRASGQDYIFAFKDQTIIGIHIYDSREIKAKIYNYSDRLDDFSHSGKRQAGITPIGYYIPFLKNILNENGIKYCYAAFPGFEKHLKSLQKYGFTEIADKYDYYSDVPYWKSADATECY